MSRFKIGCIAVAGFGVCAQAAMGVISAGWRINPISPQAILDEPALAGAVSVSLLISLSENSQFSVAGLNINGLNAQNTLPGATFYNNPLAELANSSPPLPHLFAPFPAIEHDTYVCSADGTGTLVPGRNDGPGIAQFGSGADAGIFNAAWGGSGTGVLGGQNIEIARLTMFNVATGGSTHVRGVVFASDNLQAAVGLPPIPVVAIPEPLSGGLTLLAAAAVVRRRR